MAAAPKNPYSGKSDYAYWKRSVARIHPSDVDPVTSVPFHIHRNDRIATAGSCFAQHISRKLVAEGYDFLVTEPAPEGASEPESYGIYPARTGNIYTVRQLLQTFDRAYGLFYPVDGVWQRGDGAFVDPFRPQIQARGFSSPEELNSDRKRHLRCIRAMFEDCDVFVFTLGLTEGWASTADGAVYPLAPGVAGGAFDAGRHRFVNFTAGESTADLKEFVAKLRTVNPEVRIILTVSPVPLIATFEDRHVLVSNAYSKAVLRVTAEEVARSETDVFYFPSYEIITGAHSAGGYFAEDLRSVTEAGVEQVMRVFARHLLNAEQDHRRLLREAPRATSPTLSSVKRDRLREAAKVVCDEEAIDG